jgi:glycosyltransferase involved in cell wall biosynthesis
MTSEHHRAGGDLGDLLEVMLITFNRARDLDATLAQLLASPVARCQVTVFDNCSPDDTPAVCARYARLFPDFVVRRNNCNVGLGANYLRAVEAAAKEYTWILCDDDDLDFTHFDEVAAALRADRYDLISLGVAHHSELPRGGEVRPRELIRHPRCNFLYTHSFIPCSVFRTARFTPELIQAGYRAIHTLFPHLPFLVDVVRRDAPIYLTQHDFISFRQENLGYRPLELVIGWLRFANEVPDRPIARAMRRDMLGRFYYPQKIAQYTLLERGFVRQEGVARNARRLAAEALRAGPLWLAKVLPFVAVAHLPAFLSRLLWRVAEQVVRLSEGRRIKRPTRIEFAGGQPH